MRRSNAVYFAKGLRYGAGFWYNRARHSSSGEKRMEMDMKSENVTDGDRRSYAAGAVTTIALQSVLLGLALGYSVYLPIR